MQNIYVLLNGNILSMDDQNSRYTAMAVRKGKIVRLGGEADMQEYLDGGWTALDLKGKTVLPGFIDTHQHLGLTGQVLTGLDFFDVHTMDEVLDMIREAAPQGGPKEWLLGYTLNETTIRERRLPYKAELDAVCPDRPVMIVHSPWHMCALNSKALHVLGLPKDLPGMDLDEQGNATGWVRDPGVVSHVFPSVSRLTPEDVKLASFQHACREALKQGITTLHCLEDGDYGPGDAEIVLAHADKLPLHTVLWSQILDVDKTIARGLPRIGGCICADGAIDAYTAALFEPYLDQPDNCGALNFTQQQMDDFILEAHTKGLQVAIHCETDKAIEQVLSAMEKALEQHPRKDHRHRIEHCEIPTLDQLERMGRAGITAGMQPAFMPYLVIMDEYEKMFGKERLRMLHPYRTMLDCGIVMSGGSDCPVTPHGPLTGIQAAVLHPNKKERLTPLEAIRMFTIDAAYSAFEETTRGSLEPGKIADLVILDADPTSVAPEAIRDIKIIKTIVEGKPVEDIRDGPTA